MDILEVSDEDSFRSCFLHLFERATTEEQVGRLEALVGKQTMGNLFLQFPIYEGTAPPNHLYGGAWKNNVDDRMFMWLGLFKETIDPEYMDKLEPVIGIQELMSQFPLFTDDAPVGHRYPQAFNRSVPHARFASYPNLAEAVAEGGQASDEAEAEGGQAME